jgi:hypothetical protein
LKKKKKKITHLTFLEIRHIFVVSRVKSWSESKLYLEIATLSSKSSNRKCFVNICIPFNPPLLRGNLLHKNLISHMDWVSPFPPARSLSNKKFVYFLQSPYLFTIVEMFRINFYRVSLDFSFRNTKLIVVYVIERITTPIRNVHSRWVLFRFSCK